MEFVKPKRDGPRTVKITHEDGGESQWHLVRPVTPTLRQLTECTGKFFCEELQAQYVLSIRDGALVVQINNGSKRRLTPMSRDVFIPANRLQADWIFTFARDKKGGINGLTIDFARVRGVRFQKMP